MFRWYGYGLRSLLVLDLFQPCARLCPIDCKMSHCPPSYFLLSLNLSFYHALLPSKWYIEAALCVMVYFQIKLWNCGRSVRGIRDRRDITWRMKMEESETRPPSPRYGLACLSYHHLHTHNKDKQNMHTQYLVYLFTNIYEWFWQ